jgi:hypothetical protein
LQKISSDFALNIIKKIYFLSEIEGVKGNSDRLLVQAGVDLPTVKRISGHKTPQMVERYSHQNGSHI